MSATVLSALTSGSISFDILILCDVLNNRGDDSS